MALKDNKMRKPHTVFQHILATNGGAAAVEFALISSILCAVFIGLADYGLAMFKKMELTSAARSGAQVALINSSDTSAIKQAVVSSTNLDITTSDVTTSQSCECADGTSITCGNTCSDGSTNRYFFTVTATENYTLLLVQTSMTLTGSATIRTQ
jgi:Flp pilus assembly protein TadG